jgi:hypothetical protein
MSQQKYIGMDVHQATICAAVVDAQGKVLMECVLESEHDCGVCPRATGNSVADL